MVFRAVLSCFVLLVFAVFAQAAVNPDDYVNYGGDLDSEKVIQELQPSQILDLAQSFSARKKFKLCLNSLKALVTKARAVGSGSWEQKARAEMERLKDQQEEQCDSVLNAIRQETGKQDRETLNKELNKVQAIRDQVRPVSNAQKAWAARYMAALNQWEALERILKGRPLSAWVPRKQEVVNITGQTSRLKEQVCSAKTLAEAREAFKKLTALGSKLDNLSDALKDWETFSSQTNLSGPDAETSALAADVKALVKDRDFLLNLAQSTDVDKAIETLRASENTGPKMDLIYTAKGVFNTALYDHSLISEALLAAWPGYRSDFSKDQDWRDEMRKKLRQVVEGTEAVAGKVSTSLVLPGGQTLDVELRQIREFDPGQAMVKLNQTRDRVKKWLEAAEALVPQVAYAEADEVAARDCLTTKAKDVSAQGGEDDETPVEPDTDQDGDEPSPSLDQDQDIGPDGPDGGLDGGPDGGPDGDAGDDTGDDTGGGWGSHGSGGQGTGTGSGSTDTDPGWTFNNTPLLATSGGITSTGYHVFAAGTRMGWAAGLCQYSVGPADQAIAEHMNAAGAHVFEAYQNSRAPLLAWPNYKSIQADFKRKGEKLFKEAQRPGSPYRKQLASALRQKMMGLANAVAIQVVANEIKAMENCESKYHRLGFYLAYAHQVFLIANAMEGEGADKSLIRKVKADGEQKVQSAINTLVDLDKVKLASGACARLSDLRDELRKALGASDAATKARIAETVWKEASLRIQGMSGDAFVYNGDPNELAGTWGKEGDPETIRFETADGVHYQGISSEDGVVAEMTKTGTNVYTGKFLVIYRSNGKVTDTKWLENQRIEVTGMTCTSYLRFSEEAEKPFVVPLQRVGY